MDKIQADATYLEKETKRLTSIIQKHADGQSRLAAKKLDEIKRKSNILSTFKRRTFADRNEASLNNKKNKEEKKSDGGEAKIIRQEL